MYIIDGIAYAGEKKAPVKVTGVRPLVGYKLWLRFSTGEAKIFDASPLLSFPAFAPLKDADIFSQVYIDRGITVWNDGEIDIAPEKLYEESIPCQETA